MEEEKQFQLAIRDANNLGMANLDSDDQIMKESD
jgi:hypothetical protein